MTFHHSHLAYCTNIHPAESWAETWNVLRTQVLAVRDLLRARGTLEADEPFAIGLRLSAVAARELLVGDHLVAFRDWLAATNTYVFTINGFPYGSFHGTRVKEKVFQPDWTEPARIDYTKDLFRILAAIARPGTGTSVSTLPGSHKSFAANEAVIIANLLDMALWLDDLAAETGHDFHLGAGTRTARALREHRRIHRVFPPPRSRSQESRQRAPPHRPELRRLPLRARIRFRRRVT